MCRSPRCARLAEDLYKCIVWYTCAPSFAGGLVSGVRLACLAAIGSRRFCVDVMCGKSQSDVGVRFVRVAALGSRTSGARGDLVVVLELVVSGLRGCVRMVLARVIRFLWLSRLGSVITLRLAASGALLDSSSELLWRFWRRIRVTAPEGWPASYVAISVQISDCSGSSPGAP